MRTVGIVIGHTLSDFLTASFFLPPHARNPVDSDPCSVAEIRRIFMHTMFYTSYIIFELVTTAHPPGAERGSSPPG